MKYKSKQSSGSPRDKHRSTPKQNKWKDPFFAQAVRWGTRKRKGKK